MDPQPALLRPLSGRDPDRIGSYTLMGRLGAGAMGRVYLGKSAAGRLVAVKTIRREFAEETDFRAHFAQEVAAARQVSGVFTAAVVAADPEADLPWLATAYVPAPSLYELVRRCGPLPVPAVRWLAAGCAEALDSIHSAGLVHRDLKPSNVLVAPDGPRVIDFGVARTAERVQLTVTRGAVGTPAYMAPEQARDTRQAVAASDVFSLGSTVVFAATGHAPYEGETVMDILVRLATEPPDLGGLPRELAEVVKACLQRDPRERPTPQALVTRLAPYLDAGDGEEDGHDLGPSRMPEAALALIERYEQPPRQVARVDDDDATFESYPALRTPPPAAAEPRRSRLHPLVRRRPRGAESSRPPSSLPGSGRGRRTVSVIVAVGVAVVLLVLGGLVGRSIGGGNSTPQGSPPTSPQGAAQGSPQGGGPQGITPDRQGPPDGGPPDGGPPGAGPPPPPPLSGASDEPTGDPRIVVNQPFGDGNTLFVLHGTGWTPGNPVTVAIAGDRASPYMPIVDRKGTFNYAVNEAHEFFPDAIPQGVYDVTANSPGGSHAETSFRVNG